MGLRPCGEYPCPRMSAWVCGKQRGSYHKICQDQTGEAECSLFTAWASQDVIYIAFRGDLAPVMSATGRRPTRTDADMHETIRGFACVVRIPVRACLRGSAANSGDHVRFVSVPHSRSPDSEPRQAVLPDHRRLYEGYPAPLRSATSAPHGRCPWR